MNALIRHEATPTSIDTREGPRQSRAREEGRREGWRGGDEHRPRSLAGVLQEAQRRARVESRGRADAVSGRRRLARAVRIAPEKVQGGAARPGHLGSRNSRDRSAQRAEPAAGRRRRSRQSSGQGQGPGTGTRAPRQQQLRGLGWRRRCVGSARQLRLSGVGGPPQRRARSQCRRQTRGRPRYASNPPTALSRCRRSNAYFAGACTCTCACTCACTCPRARARARACACTCACACPTEGCCR